MSAKWLENSLAGSALAIEEYVWRENALKVQSLALQWLFFWLRCALLFLLIKKRF